MPRRDNAFRRVPAQHIDNVTCASAVGYKAQPLNITLARGGSAAMTLDCHTVPIGGFASEISFMLDLGYRYNNAPMMVNGTLLTTAN